MYGDIYYCTNICDVILDQKDSNKPAVFDSKIEDDEKKTPDFGSCEKRISNVIEYCHN